MAREEAPREDLLAEARALVERAELRVEGFAEPLLIGFRINGCGSIYLGQDEAYHFNSTDELRRAYLGGLLFKAQRRRLVSLRRERSEAAVELLRADLDDSAQQQFLDRMSAELGRLRDALSRDAYIVLGQVPASAHVPARAAAWLDKLALAPPKVAERPNAT